MTIRTRILAVTVPSLLLAVLVTTAVAVIAIRRQYAEESAQYRLKEMNKTRDKLKNLVDAAYTAIESNHKEAQDKASLVKVYGSRLKDIVGIAQSITEEAALKASHGELTESEAKEMALDARRPGSE